MTKAWEADLAFRATSTIGPRARWGTIGSAPHLPTDVLLEDGMGSLYVLGFSKDTALILRTRESEKLRIWYHHGSHGPLDEVGLAS